MSSIQCLNLLNDLLRPEDILNGLVFVSDIYHQLPLPLICLDSDTDWLCRPEHLPTASDRTQWH